MHKGVSIKTTKHTFFQKDPSSLSQLPFTPHSPIVRYRKKVHQKRKKERERQQWRCFERKGMGIGSANKLV